MRISSVRYAIISVLLHDVPETAFLRREISSGTTVRFVLYEGFGRYPLGNEVLNDISDLDVAIISDRDAAFHAVTHFADVFLEAPYRADLPLEDDYIVAQQSDFGIALDHAVGDVTAGHGTHFRNAEGIAHLSASKVGLFDDRFEQSGHGALDLTRHLVTDRVQEDLNLFQPREFLRSEDRPHNEDDNHGIRRQ